MPRATVNINDTERFELKSCEGGFVVLKRMTYGQMLQRRDMVMAMRTTSSGSGKSSSTDMLMEMANKKVAVFEFSHCIVEHNLEDENEKLLDFKSINILDVLDPQIGAEIGTRIDSMNQWEEELPN